MIKSTTSSVVDFASEEDEEPPELPLEDDRELEEARVDDPELLEPEEDLEELVLSLFFSDVITPVFL